MRYALQDLLNIRELRERSAGEVVTRQRHRVSDAVRTLEGRNDDFSKYRSWRLEEEENLYGGVIGRPIYARELNDVRSTVSWLRDAELLYQKKIQEAEVALEQERKALLDAQEKQKTANRDLQKIEEHEQIWLEDWMKEQELILERELEDLHTRKVDYADAEDDEEDADGTD